MSSPDEIYRKQVIKTFFKNGLLLKIPSQSRKKDVVLQKISSRLLPDKFYTDEELNEFLKKLYPDYLKLKAELLGSRFVKLSKGLCCLVKI